MTQLEHQQQFLEMETASSLPLQQQQPSRPAVVVRTSEVPPWVRLLTAPACCVLLGLLLSPKFLVLAVIYGLTCVRPLYCCYYLPSNQKEEVLYDALSLHRSMTIQFAMLAVSLWLYEHSRLLCMPKNDIDSTEEDGGTLVVHQAFDMARRLVRWEHALGLAIEPSLQTFVMNHLPFVVAICNTYYAILHFVAPVGVMGRLIVYQKDPRYEYRVGFFIMLVFALFLFTFVPTMPPRLMPSYHAEYIETQQVTLSEHDTKILEPYWNIIDTMKQGETLYDKLHKEGGNPYAAMPSMHTGWALWSCLTWLETIDANSPSRPYQKGVAIAHVVCMVLVILITGNHFWLDSAAGATCVLLGRFLARRFIQYVSDGPLANLVRRLQLQFMLGATADGNKTKVRLEKDQGYDDDDDADLVELLAEVSRPSRNDAEPTVSEVV